MRHPCVLIVSEQLSSKHSNSEHQVLANSMRNVIDPLPMSYICLIFDLSLNVQSQVKFTRICMESEHNWADISRGICPECQFLTSRPLGCYSFQDILTNPIISQINTFLLPYFISYYLSPFTINQFHNHDAEVYAPQHLVLFTGLLCDNQNSLTYEPRKGQSPTLSRANCVILHPMLAFHSNNSNLNVYEDIFSFLTSA